MHISDFLSKWGGESDKLLKAQLASALNRSDESLNSWCRNGRTPCYAEFILKQIDSLWQKQGKCVEILDLEDVSYEMLISTWGISRSELIGYLHVCMGIDRRTASSWLHRVERMMVLFLRLLDLQWREAGKKDTRIFYN